MGNVPVCVKKHGQADITEGPYAVNGQNYQRRDPDGSLGSEDGLLDRQGNVVFYNISMLFGFFYL